MEADVDAAAVDKAGYVVAVNVGTDAVEVV